MASERGSSPTTSQRTRLTGQDSEDNIDLLCPVCFELFEEPYIVRCGHTFCYACINKAVATDPKCPTCSAVVRPEEMGPNFLLSTLVGKARVKSSSSGLRRALGSGESLPSEGLRDFVTLGSQSLTLPDVNAMLEVLNQRKLLLEAEMSSAQNELLYEFLVQLQQMSESKLEKLQREVAFIKDDLARVRSQLVGSGKDPDELVRSDALRNFPEAKSHISNLAFRRHRINANFDDFVQCYLSTRTGEGETMFKQVENVHDSSPSTSACIPTIQDYDGLDVFREKLVKFSRFHSTRTLATLNYSSDMFNNATIVSSIEFDKDQEFFAIAGVMKLIKVFDYNTVTRAAVDIHYPCVEMMSSSKISCVSWNSYHKSTLATSDYEGSVNVWDVATGLKLKTFLEHEKRCWTVDFNNVDTRLIASGSDDTRVKLWDLNSDHSVASLEAKANVCCVKFNPFFSYNLAFGSADHGVHYYDLRRMKEPLALFRGHRKAVSYVKFLNKDEFVSASTDSQLKLWDVRQTECLRSFLGHVNEKNFVGLTTNGDYVASGSENNSLYVYYKGFHKKMMAMRFDGMRSVLEKGKKDEELGEFVSAVCWRQNSNVVVAANSQGIIKVLELS